MRGLRRPRRHSRRLGARTRARRAWATATDFWNRYREDIELARGLGCTVFRLSLSWARLEPEPGAWSDDSLRTLSRRAAGDSRAGMSSMVTLVHNTWPLHVQAAGQGCRTARCGLSRSRRRVRGRGRAAARRLHRLLRDAQRTRSARLRLDQRLLDARLPHAAGAASLPERRRADGRRADRRFRTFSRTREGARCDQADSPRCARRHESARAGLAAMDTAV